MIAPGTVLTSLMEISTQTKHLHRDYSRLKNRGMCFIQSLLNCTVRCVCYSYLKKQQNKTSKSKNPPSNALVITTFDKEVHIYKTDNQVIHF